MTRLKWAAYAIVAWPVLLLALPSVYDASVPVPGTHVTASDTTYADDRFVALVPGIEDTVFDGLDTFALFVPDPDSIGSGVAYRAIRGGDSFLVISYDTLIAVALDSATADSIFADWALPPPTLYAVDVPGAPGGYPDTVGSLKHLNYEQFATTQEFLDAYGTVFQHMTTNVPGEKMQTLDTVVFYPGLTKSIRKEAIYQDSIDFCHARTIDHSYYLKTSTPDPTIREAWFEIAVKYDTMVSGGAPTWVDCGALGETGIFAWKFQQIAVTKSTGYGRWQLTGGNCGSATLAGACWSMATPNITINGDIPRLESGNESPYTTNLFDGEWHLLRSHVRMSTDSVTADGIYLLWQDTTLVIPGPNFTGADTLHASPTGVGMYAFHSGRNKDSGGFFTTGTGDLPWTEEWWIGYSTVWVAPDTPAWYSEVPIPAFAQ